jgi:hypothetical protein
MFTYGCVLYYCVSMSIFVYLCHLNLGFLLYGVTAATSTDDDGDDNGDDDVQWISLIIRIE